MLVRFRRLARVLVMLHRLGLRRRLLRQRLLGQLVRGGVLLLGHRDGGRRNVGRLGSSRLLGGRDGDRRRCRRLHGRLRTGVIWLRGLTRGGLFPCAQGPAPFALLTVALALLGGAFAAT